MIAFQEDFVVGGRLGRAVVFDERVPDETERDVAFLAPGGEQCSIRDVSHGAEPSHNPCPAATFGARAV